VATFCQGKERPDNFPGLLGSVSEKKSMQPSRRPVDSPDSSARWHAPEMPTQKA